MELIVRGAGVFTLENNAISNPQGFKVITDNNRLLEIEGKGNGTMIINRSSVVHFGDMSFGVGNSNSNSTQFGDISIINSGAGTRINGVRYKAITFQGISVLVPDIPGFEIKLSKETLELKKKDFHTKREEELDFPKTRFIPVDRLSKITVEGSATVSINQQPSRTLELRVSGSGDIESNNSDLVLSKLVANVSGSGDISLDWEVENCQACVMGSGDIKGIIITRSGVLRVQGSGDITCKRTASADVDKTVMGSGDIKCKKI